MAPVDEDLPSVVRRHLATNGKRTTLWFDHIAKKNKTFEEKECPKKKD